MLWLQGHAWKQECSKWSLISQPCLCWHHSNRVGRSVSLFSGNMLFWSKSTTEYRCINHNLVFCCCFLNKVFAKAINMMKIKHLWFKPISWSSVVFCFSFWKQLKKKHPGSLRSHGGHCWCYTVPGIRNIWTKRITICCIDKLLLSVIRPAGDIQTNDRRTNLKQYAQIIGAWKVSK